MTASQEEGEKKKKENRGRGYAGIPSPCAHSSSTHRPGPGSWALRTSVPAHSPHDTFDNLVIALVSLQIRGYCPATFGPSALSHLAWRFELAEGSLSAPARAALGHGQAAHAHCNFAIILLLPSPPRPSLTSSYPPPPSRRLASRAVLLVRIRTPRHYSLLFFSLDTISPLPPCHILHSGLAPSRLGYIGTMPSGIDWLC
ncbi:hypothetical protein F5883DRAFT_550169 [Diaporthe sp. PMI_573]|nr:hypothetical protein F5883DRAFT_550169 [Diaporthaceae sp. PMI_573]